MNSGTFEIPISLAVKLASIAVHADEMLSPLGHEFDRAALLGVVNDDEVKAWIKSLGPIAPMKRGRRA